MAELTSCMQGKELGLPWWLNGKESACIGGDMGLTPGREDSLEKEMATHSSIVAWEIWWSTAHGVAKELEAT